MTLNLPAQLPRHVPLTPGPSHNKGRSTLISSQIFERPRGSQAVLMAAHRGFKEQCFLPVSAISCFLQCIKTRPLYSSLDDAPGSLLTSKIGCFPCQSNGGHCCFTAYSMMKSVETILHKYHLSTWFSFHFPCGDVGISLVSDARAV